MTGQDLDPIAAIATARANHLERAADRDAIEGFAVPGYDPTAPFKPWGLVWAGIRIDEFARLGYTVTEDTTLEAGWVRPHPVDPSQFAVWSLADWAMLIEISARWHKLRRQSQLITAATDRVLAATPTVELLEFVAGREIEASGG